MKNKYYTPELVEFHIGFEYEYKLFKDSDVWEKMSFGFDIVRNDKFCNPEIVPTRVKYLDEQDIIDLGFERIINKLECGDADYRINLKENTSLTLKSEEDKWIMCTNNHLDYHGQDVFEMTVKNKNELFKLMKQLGV